MQTTDNATSQYESASSRPLGGTEQGAQGLAPQATFADYKVIRRNGSVVSFEPSKIAIAVTKAFLAVNGGQGAASARVLAMVTEGALITATGKRIKTPIRSVCVHSDSPEAVETALNVRATLEGAGLTIAPIFPV